MRVIYGFLLVAACLLAYWNGANDNAKGIATLYGSGTADFRKAIRWATATTLLGSVAAIFLASALLNNFSGKGLVSDALVQTPAFATSVALGAALTVLMATRVQMPISTTHSLVGALSGAGAVAMGSAFNLAKLGSTFLFPLLVSPLLAAIGSYVVYHVFRAVRLRLGVTRETCVCRGSGLPCGRGQRRRDRGVSGRGPREDQGCIGRSLSGILPGRSPCKRASFPNQCAEDP